MDKLKSISAVLFQFTILGILTWCLYAGIGEPDTIVGALIGLAVGVGLNTIKE